MIHQSCAPKSEATIEMFTLLAVVEKVMERMVAFSSRQVSHMPIVHLCARF